MERNFYVGREDGVAAATDEIIRANRAVTGSTEFADIILCTGAQHAVAADLRHSIRNAHAILREGGMLIIRSLARPAEGELGTRTLSDWAFDASF